MPKHVRTIQHNKVRHVYKYITIKNDKQFPRVLFSPGVLKGIHNCRPQYSGCRHQHHAQLWRRFLEIAVVMITETGLNYAS